MLLLPLYWQDVRGADPLMAGLLLVPQGIGTFLSRSLAGWLTDRIGAKSVTVAGFAIVGLATIPFAIATPATNQRLLMAALVVRGFGLGAVTIPLMTVAYLGLDRVDVPQASILTRITQQVGGSFGVALLAVILQSALAQRCGNVAATTRSTGHSGGLSDSRSSRPLSPSPYYPITPQPRSALPKPKPSPRPAGTRRVAVGRGSRVQPLRSARSARATSLVM